MKTGCHELVYNHRVTPGRRRIGRNIHRRGAPQLAPYFTNLDGHVFALTNLPETVKGALFARYSRSAKSLRRLFLDEFAGDVAGAPARRHEASASRAREKLYARVFNEYGDDSVAQLGGAHIACEYVSNILTKVLEWGRLMAYLEQSTRYVPYTDKLHGRWRYHVPAECRAGRCASATCGRWTQAFELYARWIPAMQEHFAAQIPEERRATRTRCTAPRSAPRRSTRCAACCRRRRSRTSGIYGTGQAYEALLLRMRAHPLDGGARLRATQMLDELRKVIPAFLTRVDQPDRGGRWSEYLAAHARRARATRRRRCSRTSSAEPRDEVTLTDFDPDGEIKVVAAALYAVSDLPDDQLLAAARRDDRRTSARRCCAPTSASARNRRHRPGRAFERTAYRFDVLTDYGAFRDLQRHRLLTLEWQPLTTRHGYTEPDAIREAGARDDWDRVMDASAELLRSAALAPDSTPRAQYAVAMAYRVRFYMEMNAREAMHVIELRTAPQGHPAYRRVCQQMHRLIAERAGHRAVADAMRFADHSEVELERLRLGARARDGSAA